MSTIVSFERGWTTICRFATDAKKALAQRYAGVLLVDAGDAIQGAPLGAISGGKALYACLQGYIDEVRDKGADFVIPVAHLGNGNDATEAFRSPEVIARLTGRRRRGHPRGPFALGGCRHAPAHRGYRRILRPRDEPEGRGAR
ncbi:MAG: hypothetical protein IKE76_11630 [Clostridia bacterium]|nr:hypothetical protein [Clostridia bacterium]